MALLLKNNAYSKLAASLTDIATSLTVTTGHGNRFPIAANPDYFKITLQDAANNIEIVKVTERANNADTMTIQRAQEGTVARAWNIDDIVELRITAGVAAPLGVLAEAATAAGIRTAIGAFASAGGSISGDTDITGTLQVIGNLSYTGTLTGGTGVINIGSGQLYKTAGGDVGIGTTNPIRKFMVTTGAAAGVALFESTAGSAVAIGLRNTGSSANFAQLVSEGDSIYFQTSGAKRFEVDSAGNAGLGVTPSAWVSSARALQLANFSAFAEVSNGGTEVLFNAFESTANAYTYRQSDAASRYRLVSGQHVWYNAPSGTAGNPITFTQAMTLGQNGRLDIGSSGSTENAAALRVNRGAGNPNYIELTTVGGDSRILAVGISGTAANLIFSNAASGGGVTERARITSGGYFKASNTGSYGGVAGLADQSASSIHVFQTDLNNGSNLIAVTGQTGTNVMFNSFLPTGSTGFHFRGNVNAVTVFQVLANGNVQNTNNSYGAISDAKLKENVTDASSYLDRFMQVRFRNFNFIGSDLKQFGVIAQELETVFPGLVDTTPDVDEEGNDLGTVTKSVKYSILAQIQGKVIQEQQAIIEQQQAVLADVLARLSALESK